MRRRAVLLVCVCVCVSVRARLDELFRARCAAACTDAPSKIQCESGCVLTTKDKPGVCPPRSNLTWYESACLSACSRDVDCPGTEKCCPHECGTTCQHALALDTDPGLPSVPADLRVSDSKRPRCKMLEWSASPGPSPVFYVVQERRHPGLNLQPQLFGPWKARSRRRKSRMQLSGLTPAHWYQIRVAAVSSNGSRGYSAPSRAFTLQIEPARPAEPQNLTVHRLGWVHGRLWAEIRWKRPPSDLPLHHYKVFWSHCVKSEIEESSVSNSCIPKSVIVNHKTVNYKTTNFIFKGLEPLSLYFIQVQAVTIPYRLKKLSSEKAATFIDTNKHKNATYNWRLQLQNPIKHLRVSKFFLSAADKLEARVTWESSPGHFQVSWLQNSSCGAQNNPTYKAITEARQYDIDHLEFNCKYQVIVTANNSNKSAKINMKTPHCSEMNSKGKLSCL